MYERTVTAPDETDLALADKIVEGAKRLFDRSQRIESMDLIEIDVIGPDSPQAVFDFVENT